MQFTSTKINPKLTRRRFKLVLLSLSFLIATGIVLLYIASQDLKTVDDADLILEPLALLPVDDNAYHVMPVIAELSESKRIEVEEAVAVATNRSSSSPEQAVANTRFLTDAFIAASKKAGYQCPTSVNQYSITGELCSLNDMRNLAELGALRASVALVAMDVEDSVESSLAIVRMAHYVSNSATTLIEQLVAMAMYDIASSQLENLVTVTNNKEEILFTLERYQPTLETLPRGLRADYMQFKSEVAAMTDGTSVGIDVAVPVGYRWQPNRTQQEMADFYRLEIEGISTPCGESNEELIQQIKVRVLEMSEMSPFIRLKPNSVGNAFIAVTSTSLVELKQQTCDSKQTYNLLIEELRT